ncbi:D-glycero-beta-D-manno-heptose-7-phosphate kinase [Oceanidesulfovibrio marinus]|uniref:D-glycero-beta-D-manno-heptose-7-phosphate kinase n=1 Tax=Oceanidesulfovibrio marinus TaxID=370038 RepID=A0ABX6NK64_9BACT|nr:D-glycero-beta-D-manno-heptose-7-phosphate kinase [Oceanidesulfovibrio marinus]QJT10030.1 D-glycero-beta-D-manno-heptose-7-phosphate kinase [Oceanidesulfovibrio marinus]
MSRKNVDRDALIASLGSLNGSQVLVVGDLMLDHYLVGNVERISPEAPVPVVTVKSEHLLLGGAGNVALNIARLGGDPYLIGVTGSDDNAENLRQLVAMEELEGSLVSVDDRPTTIKTRIIAQNQQVARVDKEISKPLTLEQTRGVLNAIAEIIDEFEVIVLSDYGKGLVTMEFMDAFRALVLAQDRPPKVLVDPKLKNFNLYKGAYCVTPNSKEALEAAHRLQFESRVDVLRTGASIFRQLACEHVLITLGPNGMALFDTPSEVFHFPTVAKRVFDVTGAGDTVIATLGVSLAAGHDLLTAALLANYAAGNVIGEVGTATTTQEALINAIRYGHAPEIVTWLSEKEGASS